jgi:hypothetical protein
MLCGLPFIASPVGGIPEQAAGFGHLLKEGSVEDVAASIGHVLNHYEQFQAASPAMSEYAMRTYSIESMVKRHLELFERLIGVSPRRHHFWMRGFNPLVRAIARHWGTSGPPRRASPVQAPAAK